MFSGAVAKKGSLFVCLKCVVKELGLHLTPGDRTFYRMNLSFSDIFDNYRSVQAASGVGWLLKWVSDCIDVLRHLHPRGDAGGLSREYVLRIPIVS